MSHASEIENPKYRLQYIINLRRLATPKINMCFLLNVAFSNYTETPLDKLRYNDQNTVYSPRWPI